VVVEVELVVGAERADFVGAVGRVEFVGAVGRVGFVGAVGRVEFVGAVGRVEFVGAGFVRGVGGREEFVVEVERVLAGAGLVGGVGTLCSGDNE